MTTLSAALFDFDNTLINTKALEQFRENKEFALITDEHISQTRIYKPVLHTLKKLKQKGLKIGIVTNSPQSYVERVAKYHGIYNEFDAVVTYGDVGHAGKKPAPTGIELALKKMGVSDPSRVIYIGDEYTDMIAAYRAGTIPIVPSWASRKSVSTPPAAELSSAGVVEMVDDIEEMMLFAERCALHQSTNFDRRLAHFIPLDDEAEVLTIRERLKIFCLGRYFSQRGTTTAQLHDKHPLSMEIVKKDQVVNYRPPDWMADMLLKICKSAGLYLFNGSAQIDLVTVVPAKNGKPKRLEHLLEYMSTMAKQASIPIEFRSDLLYFDDGAAKSIKGYDATEREIEQNLHLHCRNVDLTGRHVIVIDDVITTGATMIRSLNLLEGLNATSVHGVGVAKTVSFTEEAKHCPECGRSMILAKNRETQERFWSCNGYFEEKACTYTEPFEVKNCPKCGSPLRVRVNKKDQSKFLGCSGFFNTPSCRYTAPIAQ